MKKILIFAVVGLLALPLFFPDDATTAGQPEVVRKASTESVSPRQVSLLEAEKASLFVSGTRVNVRSGPGVSNSIMGQLSFGDEVKVVSYAGGWREIETKLGVGWMSARYLVSQKPAPKPASTQSRQRSVAAPTTREIQAARTAIIRQSIAAYPGSCPCPYNTDRAGRRCGGRSAWSKPGGYSPICYESDVTDARLASYLSRRTFSGN